MAVTLLPLLSEATSPRAKLKLPSPTTRILWLAVYAMVCSTQYCRVSTSFESTYQCLHIHVPQSLFRVILSRHCQDVMRAGTKRGEQSGLVRLTSMELHLNFVLSFRRGCGFELAVAAALALPTFGHDVNSHRPRISPSTTGSCAYIYNHSFPMLPPTSACESACKLHAAAGCCGSTLCAWPRVGRASACTVADCQAPAQCGWLPDSGVRFLLRRAHPESVERDHEGNPAF